MLDAWIDETCGGIAPAHHGSDRGASTGALAINRLVPAIEPGFDAKRVSRTAYQAAISPSLSCAAASAASYSRSEPEATREDRASTRLTRRMQLGPNRAFRSTATHSKTSVARTDAPTSQAYGVRKGNSRREPDRPSWSERAAGCGAEMMRGGPGCELTASV